jgi:hypothetical protein
MATEWTVRVRLQESDGAVIATATLVDEDEQTLSATAQYRPAAADGPTSHAQFELATARALQRLSDALVAAAIRTGAT